jgi:hypothetical protein
MHYSFLLFTLKLKSHLNLKSTNSYKLFIALKAVYSLNLPSPLSFEKIRFFLSSDEPR